MSKKIYCSPDDAVEIIKQLGVTVSKPTVINWAKNYNIGKQTGKKGSRWIIKISSLKKFLENNEQGKVLANEQNKNSSQVSGSNNDPASKKNKKGSGITSSNGTDFA